MSDRTQDEVARQLALETALEQVKNVFRRKDLTSQQRWFVEQAVIDMQEAVNEMKP